MALLASLRPSGGRFAAQLPTPILRMRTSAIRTTTDKTAMIGTEATAEEVISDLVENIVLKAKH